MTRDSELINSLAGLWDFPQGLKAISGQNYCNFAYSALACFRMGMSGSASFQRVRKS